MYYCLRWAALDANGVPVSHTKPVPGMFLLAVAESADGVVFTKPALDGFPFRSALNGANVSRSNILAVGAGTPAIWVTDNGPLPDKFYSITGSRGDVGYKVESSADGLRWVERAAAVPVPPLEGMGGLDTFYSVFWDPGCRCHATFTRLWYRGGTKSFGDYTGNVRLVRRVDLVFPAGHPERGSVARQALALRPDAADLAAHTPALAFPAVGFYGATAWARDYGDGQRGYFMAPARYWHWQGGDARPGEGGEPATYDVPLLWSRDGYNFTYLGAREPFTRPTREAGVGNRRIWLAAPVVVGDDELFYVTRGNMNEDGEVANATGGAAKAFRSQVAVGRLRVHGAVSLDAPYGRSVNATTRILVFPASARGLVLNVDASAGGSVVVQVRTPKGRVLLGPVKERCHKMEAAVRVIFLISLACLHVTMTPHGGCIVRAGGRTTLVGPRLGRHSWVVERLPVGPRTPSRTARCAPPCIGVAATQARWQRSRAPRWSSCSRWKKASCTRFGSSDFVYSFTH